MYSDHLQLYSARTPNIDTGSAYRDLVPSHQRVVVSSTNSFITFHLPCGSLFVRHPGRSRPSRARPPPRHRAQRVHAHLLTMPAVALLSPPEPTHKMAPKKSIEKPKKKLSGYMLFSQERRPKLKSERPNLTFGEVRETAPSIHPLSRHILPSSTLTSRCHHDA